MSLPQQQAPRDPPGPDGDEPGVPRTRRPIITVERTRPLPMDVDRKVQAKEAAELVAFKARRFVRDLAEDFRAADVHSKVKLGIILAWTLTTVLSIFVAMQGRPEDPAANELRAKAMLTRTSLGWGLLVQNSSSGPWTSLRLSLPEGYVFEKPFVAAGEELVLGSAQFLKDGLPPPAQMRPTRLDLSADQGDVEIPLGGDP